MSYDRDKTDIFIVPDDNMRILVLEDNKVVAEYLRSILRRNFNPCTIIIVDAIGQGIVHVNQTHFHLILLDTTLDLKGEDCCAAIREIETNTPILLMAVAETQVRHESIIGCGADGIVYKPILVDDLLSEIKRVIHIDLTQRGTPSSLHKAIRLPKEDTKKEEEDEMPFPSD